MGFLIQSCSSCYCSVVRMKLCNYRLRLGRIRFLSTFARISDRHTIYFAVDKPCNHLKSLSAHFQDGESLWLLYSHVPCHPQQVQIQFFTFCEGKPEHSDALCLTTVLCLHIPYSMDKTKGISGNFKCVGVKCHKW